MPNTRIEALIVGIDDGATLEQLAADLLRREGYDVDPTGTRGADNKRDALLSRNGEQGILHCSISQGLENKLHDDAQKAADRNEDYDFFIFATTQNPSGSKRDRLEDDITKEYGWRTRIYDLQRLRNKLQGNSDNRDLVDEHLRNRPTQAFADPREDTEEFYPSRLDQLEQREGYPGTIASNHPITHHHNTPILTVYIIPTEAVGGSHDRLAADLPDPPTFVKGIQTQRYGDYVVTGTGSEPFTSYACFHEDGWAEAATIHTTADTDGQDLTRGIDTYVVDFLEDALDWYKDAGIRPPFDTYLTLLSAEDFTFYVGDEDLVIVPDSHRPIGTDRFEFGSVRIDSYDADVPSVLRKPLYRLWNQGGWPKSRHYTEIEEDGETQYKWDPLSKFN